MRYFVRLLRARFALPFLLAVLGFALAGCKSMPIAENPPNIGSYEPTNGDSELLRPGDLLKFTFQGPSNLTIPVHEERVPESGYITLPDIGKVEAVGKTRVQLQEAVRAKYVPAHYRELSVTIAPAERFFYVAGEVRKEDRHPYLGKETLTGAISAAGGFSEFADKKNISVTRTDGTVLRAHYPKALENPTKFDLKILPGDKINVPRRYY